MTPLSTSWASIAVRGSAEVELRRAESTVGRKAEAQRTGASRDGRDWRAARSSKENSASRGGPRLRNG